MSEILRDQAEGLRRLLGADFVRSVVVVGGAGVGKSLLMTHLARALADQGQGVTALVEKPTLATAAFGVELHVAAQPGIKSLAGCLVDAGPSLKVGLLPRPAAKAPEPTLRSWWQSGLEALRGDADVLLTEQPTLGARPHPLTLAAQEVVLVVSPHAETLTAAYGWMKRLARDFSRDRFHVLANRADPAQGEHLFAHLKDTTRRFVGAKLEYLGAVPVDPVLPWKPGRKPLSRPAGAFSPGLNAIRRAALTMIDWPRPWEAGGYVNGLTERLLTAQRLLAEETR